MSWLMMDFTACNIQRCQSVKGFKHAIDSWSLSDWMTALVGEVGEAANIIKKLNRIRDNVPGNKESKDELYKSLESELADIFIYLDLLCIASGFFLHDIVPRKFDVTSEKIGYPKKIAEMITGVWEDD